MEQVREEFIVLCWGTREPTSLGCYALFQVTTLRLATHREEPRIPWLLPLCICDVESLF